MHRSRRYSLMKARIPGYRRRMSPEFMFKRKSISSSGTGKSEVGGDNGWYTSSSSSAIFLRGDEMFLESGEDIVRLGDG